jgi:hypothetical protein
MDVLVKMRIGSRICQGTPNPWYVRTTITFESLKRPLFNSVFSNVPYDTVTSEIGFHLEHTLRIYHPTLNSKPVLTLLTDTFKRP